MAGYISAPNEIRVSLEGKKGGRDSGEATISVTVFLPGSRSQPEVSNAPPPMGDTMKLTLLAKTYKPIATCVYLPNLPPGLSLPCAHPPGIPDLMPAHGHSGCPRGPGQGLASGKGQGMWAGMGELSGPELDPRVASDTEEAGLFIVVPWLSHLCEVLPCEKTETGWRH